MDKSTLISLGALGYSIYSNYDLEERLTKTIETQQANIKSISDTVMVVKEIAENAQANANTALETTGRNSFDYLKISFVLYIAQLGIKSSDICNFQMRLYIKNTHKEQTIEIKEFQMLENMAIKLPYGGSEIMFDQLMYKYKPQNTVKITPGKTLDYCFFGHNDRAYITQSNQRAYLRTDIISSYNAANNTNKKLLSSCNPTTIKDAANCGVRLTLKFTNLTNYDTKDFEINGIVRYIGGTWRATGDIIRGDFSGNKSTPFTEDTEYDE